MRAAAILGLGSSPKYLKPFQKNASVDWILGLPASPKEADVVLLFGGDGTIHRHLSALVELGLPVLIVPCGSGNDFARAVHLHSVKDSLAAWEKFAAGTGHVRAIDLGVITPRGQESGRFFCCAGGIGLDAEIARHANQLPRRLRRHGGYLFSLLPALVKSDPVFTRILTPLGGTWDTRVAKPTFVALFANALAYGGGMKIAPRALLDDGKLDICIVGDLAKFKLLCLFPSVYFGRHLTIPQVEYFQTERLRLETEEPLEVYADGEYVCRTPVEISVAGRVLRVVTL